jgi:hypothetical protein
MSAATEENLSNPSFNYFGYEPEFESPCSRVRITPIPLCYWMKERNIKGEKTKKIKKKEWINVAACLAQEKFLHATEIR